MLKHLKIKNKKENMKETLDSISSKHGLWAVILLAILLIPLLVAFQGLIIWFVWNYLVIFLIPTLPAIGFIKSCVAGVVLSVLGSFFRGSK